MCQPGNNCRQPCFGGGIDPVHILDDEQQWRWMTMHDHLTQQRKNLCLLHGGTVVRQRPGLDGYVQ